LRRLPPGALRQADCQHLGPADQPGADRCVHAVQVRRDRVLAGHLGREDGQSDRPLHLAGVAAQQVRGLYGSRDAAARPRDGRQYRSGDRFSRERYDNVYQPGLFQPRGTAAWYAGARKSDNSNSLLWNASSAQLGNYPDKYNIMGAVSYVTGTHTIKVGIQDAWGPYLRWNSANADL